MTQRLRSLSARPLSRAAEVDLERPCAVEPDRISRVARRKPLFVCFSHLRWDFVWQRPQHLLVRAARDHDVLFLEEPIHEEVLEPRLDLTPRPGGIQVGVPVLPHGTWGDDAVAAQRRLIDTHLAADGRAPAVLWYYTPMAMPFSDHLGGGLAVYDNMDELSAFRGASPEMLANEAALFERADLVFTGGESLWEAKQGRHPDVTAFPSSIDAAHFGVARASGIREPDDQASIPGPRLGFFGVIDERMDMALVARVAELRPHWHLVMIGPVVKIDPAGLPRADNVHWLGHKAYADLPDYLSGWDLGLMPFALNESTRFISPTKTPEYLAAGVPVISTRIRDVVRPYGDCGLVEIADDAEGVVRMAEQTMRRARKPWLRAVDRHLANCSWDRTWAAMATKMRSRARPAGPLPALRGVRPARARAGTSPTG